MLVWSHYGHEMDRNEKAKPPDRQTRAASSLDWTDGFTVARPAREGRNLSSFPVGPTMQLS
jgi:hypothetical protein